MHWSIGKYYILYIHNTSAIYIFIFDYFCSLSVAISYSYLYLYIHLVDSPFIHPADRYLTLLFFSPTPLYKMVKGYIIYIYVYMQGIIEVTRQCSFRENVCKYSFSFCQKVTKVCSSQNPVLQHFCQTIFSCATI